MEKSQIVVAGETLVNPFQARMLGLIEKHLKPEESIIKCATGNSQELERERLLRLLKLKPSALIGISIRPELHVVESFKAARVPIVLIDEDSFGASSVATDNFAGGCLVGDYLVRKGHKRIAVVCGKMQKKGDRNAVQRLNGLRTILSFNGLRLPLDGLIEVADYSFKEGVESMAKLVNRIDQLDAIFSAAGDLCAAGLMKTAKDRDIKVPENLAIIGFDDVEVAASLSLTTVRQPLEKIAEAAYNMVANEREQILVNPRMIVFKPELIVRDSA